MKNIISLIAILFLSVNSNAQIKEISSSKKEVSNTIIISKVQLLGNLIGQLNKEATKDFYSISYKDFKNNNRNDIKVFNIGNKETVKQYRDIMISMIDNKTNKKIIELEGNTISFNRKSNSVETLITNNAGETSQMKWIAKKQIKLLFPENKLN